MINPWFSFPVAFIIAALVTVGTMALFTTSPYSAAAQENDDLPPGIATANEAGLLAFAKSGKTDQRVAALLRLGESTKNWSQVLPVVANSALETDEFVRLAAAEAIKRMGPEASKHLEPLVTSDDPQVYRSACAVTQILGADAAEWFPEMRKYLKNDDPNLVMATLFGIQNMGPAVLPAMDELIALLDHKDFNIQCGVCRICERLRADAAPAQDRLVVLLNEGVVSARSWAAIALGAIGPSTKHDITALLREKLSAFTQIEKERALIGLGYLGPEAKEALDEVERLMNDPSKSTQCQAALAYWQITGKSEQPIKVLRKKLGESSYKRIALQRFGDMGTAAAPVLGEMMKLLDDEEDDVREIAVMSIAKLGAKAEPALEKLKSMLRDDDLLLRQAAGDAIRSIEAATKTADSK